MAESLTMLPFRECTDEVLTDVAKRILPWCKSIMDGVRLDDPLRTPFTEDATELKELVERMAANLEFRAHMEAVVERVADGRAGKVADAVLADAIFWFLMGWKAADERLRRLTEGVM